MDKWIKENKITTSIVIVLAIIFGVVYLYEQSVENQIPKTSTMNVSGFDLQTKCASAANLYFDKVKSDQSSQDYQSHWNNQQGKCFIKITSQYPISPPAYDGGIGVELYDAIEGVYYGAMITDSTGAIRVCMYGKSDGDGNGMKTCRTNTEFDSYMTSIMGN